MKLVTPNYNKRTPIVNDNAFVTGNPPLATPTIGSPQDTFNPGGGSGVLPSGPPKYVQPKGKRAIAKGLTNKRLPLANV